MESNGSALTDLVADGAPAEMKLMVDGTVYSSADVPILIEFDPVGDRVVRGIVDQEDFYEDRHEIRVELSEKMRKLMQDSIDTFLAVPMHERRGLRLIQGAFPKDGRWTQDRMMAWAKTHGIHLEHVPSMQDVMES